MDHIEELRKRLLKSALAVVLMTIIALYFSEQLLAFVVAPLGGVKLHVTEVTGSFNAYLKIALIAGVLSALPVIFYQLWTFISPGLYRQEKSMVMPLVTISTLLFLAGAAFCYFLILPLSLKFLIDFSGGLFSPIITVGSYISFAGMLILAFGVGFELPIVTYFLGRMGIVSSQALSKGRRYAAVIILITSAIFTPTPDVFTQMMLAVPMYLLYELSIVIVRITGKNK